MKLAQAEVFEVATFYHHFDIVREGDTAPPALTVRVCDGLSCEMAGAQDLLARLPGLLGTDVRVIAAPCIGRCEQAPAAVVGQNPVPRATTDAVQALVAAKQTRHEPEGFVDLAAYKADGGYALLRQCIGGELDVDDVIKTLETSGLRGLGGAGFPAGRKWRIVRSRAGAAPDGGQHRRRRAGHLQGPRLPRARPASLHRGHADRRVGGRHLEDLRLPARRVPRLPRAARGRAGEAARRAAVSRHARDRPAPRRRRVHLRRRVGDDRIDRRQARHAAPRPPYVAQVGLFGRPTLEHNFETLYWVRDLLDKGGEWFAAQGRNGRKGLRSFSVSGRVRDPGVKLAPAGITLQELIDEHCGGMLPGHTLYGYLPGGASGGILPASLANIPLDFDTLQPYGCFIGSAAVVVLSDHDSAIGAARNTMRFFEHESCGQCTPCRNGTAKASLLMASDRWDLPLLADLSLVMRDASICGLGQAAPNPIDCVVKYFPHELGIEP